MSATDTAFPMRRAQARARGLIRLRLNEVWAMAAFALDTPTGSVTVMQEDEAITAVTWGDAVPGGAPTPLLAEAGRQIAAYFDGRLQQFDLPLRVVGSRSQRVVCKAIAAIPFGETRSYGDLARDLGLPAQVVGQGCGGNPIPLLIPCHRVLAANGLGGFSGGSGIETKIWLLRHEKAGGLLI
jgi:methylated-DNA-[protein]-cysteine S-methyltransferase